ncbi:hypothetical protein [Caudoviricetes sp.]|nr:hypothetical protein [Caudoviricetes sp.]
MSDYSTYDDSQFMFDLFGSPQYQEGGGVPGNSFSQRAAALKSLISLTGLPLPQLLAGGATQEQAAPFVNETAQIYGNNPMYQEAFAAIDQGADPQSVMSNLLAKSGDYGFDGNDATTTARIFDTLNSYARDRVKGQQYEMENADPNRSFTLANGKQYKGDPNIMGMASEYDLMGAPDPKQLLNQYALERGTKMQRAKQEGVAKTMGVPLADRGGSQADPAIGFGGPLLDKMEKMQAAGMTPIQRKAFEQTANHRIERSKANMVRSDANSSAMRNLLAVRALLGM